MSDLPVSEVPWTPVDGVNGTHHITTAVGVDGDPVFVIAAPADGYIELTRGQMYDHLTALIDLLARTPLPMYGLDTVIEEGAA